MSDDQQQTLTALTVELLSAFVANNNVRSEDLPALIAATHQALSGLGATIPEPDEPVAEEHVAAVTARKSLADRNVILSMIDGKPYKSLKRHLTSRGMSPEDYRSRYRLPASYPMVAPGYSEERRAVAKRLGLGRKRSAPATEADGEPTEPRASALAAVPAKRKYTRRAKSADSTT